MPNKIIFTFCMVLMIVCSQAQDNRYSQFYASPLTLNPALTGSFDGKFRVASILRDQWRKTLDRPISSFSGSIDMRFPVNLTIGGEDAIGGGITFQSDKLRNIGYNHDELTFYGSIHKALNSDGSQVLSAGFSFAFAQKSINYNELIFGDQFNGIDFGSSSAEALPKNNVAYSDLNLGVNYAYNKDDDFGLYIGGMIGHITSPVVSFYEDEEDAETLRLQLNRRYTTHISAKISTGRGRSAVYPRALYSIQGSSSEFMGGADFRVLFNDYSSIALHLGSWLRFEKYIDESYKSDVLVAFTGLEYQNILFGFSYDIQLNDKISNPMARNAFECSIAFLGNYENETVTCPSF